MKKQKRLILLAPFATAAVILRAAQCRTGFGEDGLAVKGNVPGLLLPAVLLLAAICFALEARKLPAKRGEHGSLAETFRFTGNIPAALFAVSGVFLTILGAAALLLAERSMLVLLLGMLTAVSALCVLYVVFGLYRGGEAQGGALLVPVCYLLVYVILLYREDASNPILARIYVEILAVALITCAALERAAFAFQNGSRRWYLPVSAMALILCAAAAAELRSAVHVLLFGGCALVELGFLCAAAKRRQDEEAAV